MNKITTKAGATSTAYNNTQMSTLEKLEAKSTALVVTILNLQRDFKEFKKNQKNILKANDYSPFIADDLREVKKVFKKSIEKTSEKLEKINKAIVREKAEYQKLKECPESTLQSHRESPISSHQGQQVGEPKPGSNRPISAHKQPRIKQNGPFPGPQETEFRQFLKKFVQTNDEINIKNHTGDSAEAYYDGLRLLKQFEHAYDKDTGKTSWSHI